MNQLRWYLNLAVSLVASSALVYAVQILFFHRNEDTFFYMVQDFAFVPIQVLLVTLIINSLLRNRERTSLQRKLNMVIGTFFSEMGTRLLKKLSVFDTDPGSLTQAMLIRADWTDHDYASALRLVRSREHTIDCRPHPLQDLKSFLLDNRVFLLTLLENPNLLEHETFSDLLWAICHLMEELWHRDNLDQLPESDCRHLSGDIHRAYSLLIVQWLNYVKHLKVDYPYMYSLIIRTNPFDPEAEVVVK